MAQRQDPPDQRGGVQKLMDRLGLSLRLLFDGRVDMSAKLIPIATLLYILSPIDFAPEVIFGPFGLIDDVGVAILGLEFFIRMAPSGVVQEHLEIIKGRLQRQQQHQPRQPQSQSQAQPEEDVIEGQFTRRN